MENQTANIKLQPATPVLQGQLVIEPQAAPQIKKVLQVLDDTVTQVIDPYKLLATLYFLFDAFERAQLDFFLVRQTARDAMTGHELTGDHLDIGIRHNEWLSDAKDILFTYFEQEHVTKMRDEPGLMTFDWQGTSFTLHIYEENPCITALIPVAYEYESWKIPNQFERFEKEFDK